MNTVDNSKPKTKINIRLYTGEVITQEFNLSNRVNDIRAYVNTVAPVSGSFDLVEGFPPKPLQGNGTIEELKIQGSTIMQRLN